ncbi:hypothetical protein CC79DRAFT_1370483 [Sarocladium strictum]
MASTSGSTPAAAAASPSDAAPPRPRRSRNGCIGCRKAKVKCDEVKPRCGTCHRRSLVCPGYAPRSRLTAGAQTVDTPSPAPASTPVPDDDAATVRTVSTPAAENWSAGTLATTRPSPLAGQMSLPTQGGSSDFRLDYFGSSLSLLPSGVVTPADERNIALYFNRHPSELIMGDEFVTEMNANTLLLLQQDPATVANVLAAIGYVYHVRDTQGSDIPVLARRSRILSDLRLMKPSSSYLEMALHLLLALCAMELVTFAQPRTTTSIPMLLDHVSFLITHHHSPGGTLSFVSRYLLRGLARQDLIVSLVGLRRFRVPTYAWLDYDASTKPDRLLGCTATLMPLLEELCALAEELRHQILQPYFFQDSLGLTVGPLDQEIPWDKVESLRQRLQSWQPPTVKTGSFKTTRKFHVQAACYRAGALLYLHRLVHRPSMPSADMSSHALTAPSPQFDLDDTSGLDFLQTDSTSQELSLFSLPDPLPLPTAEEQAEVEAEAIHKAHEILLYAGGLPASDVKLLLWPVFLAACEMNDPEDRAAVLEVFNAILDRRKTVTVLQTKSFVENVVWRARDEGKDWNWMRLAQDHPGECLPI